MPKPSMSNTAYYCCGARFLDAESDNPVCGDNYAKIFMDQAGLEIFKRFDDKTLEKGKIANATRHRIIDDLIRDTVKANPDAVFILIGAGFDTRAYRIPGGVWIEIDDPNLISMKNKRLPVSDCKNSLERIPYDYKVESLKDKLPPIKPEIPVTVVVEGVFFYLIENDIKQLLDALYIAFPNHTLICDLQTRKFFKKYNKLLSEIMNKLGSPFKISSEKPEEIFIRKSYEITEKISIIEKVVEFGKIRVPGILLKTVLKNLKYGYSIFVFNFNGNDVLVNTEP